jgi:hypothetical protein
VTRERSWAVEAVQSLSNEVAMNRGNGGHRGTLILISISYFTTHYSTI